MEEREPSVRYVESVRKLGREMKRKDGTGEVVFTDHAIIRMYNKRVHVAKVLMTVDNPDKVLESEVGERYKRLIKDIGQRTVYVSVVPEEESVDKTTGEKTKKVVVISVAWRARGRRKKGRSNDSRL